MSSTAIPSLEGRLGRELSAVVTQHRSTAKDALSQGGVCARALEALTLLCSGMPTELPTATGALRVSFPSLFVAGVLKSVLYGYQPSPYVPSPSALSLAFPSPMHTRWYDTSARPADRTFDPLALQARFRRSRSARGGGAAPPIAPAGPARSVPVRPILSLARMLV